MAILYRGREMLCFMARQAQGCTKHAAFRVEGPNLLMHVCADHVETAKRITEGEAIPLVTAGTDRLDATSLDNADLATMPWIEDVNAL